MRARFSANFIGLDECIVWAEECLYRYISKQSRFIKQRKCREGMLDNVGLALFESVGNFIEHEILRVCKNEVYENRLPPIEGMDLECKLKFHAYKYLSLRVQCKRYKGLNRKKEIYAKNKKNLLYGGYGVQILRKLGVHWRIIRKQKYALLLVNIQIEKDSKFYGLGA